MSDIVIRQRGEPAVLTTREYEEHWSEYLSVLEKHRVINVRRSGRHVLVHPSQYVGTARCPAGRVRIEPRFPDLLSELKRLFPRGHRMVPLPGFLPGGTRITGSDVVAGFLQTLADVIHVGFPFTYEHRVVPTSTLSGSLDIGRTIREFDSIGIHHKVVVRQTRRTPSQALLAVIYAALEVLADENLLAAEEVALSDTLSAALPGLTLVVSRQEALELIEQIVAERPDRPDIAMLCALARSVIVPTMSVEDIQYASDGVSFLFTDADALWERAVHASLSDAAASIGWHARLHPIRGLKTLLYPDGGPDIDPDIIVYAGPEARCVVDAKDFAAVTPGSSGVYQVDSYARRLDVRDAGLFYLATTSEWRESFGDGSVRVWSFAVAASGPGVLHRLRVACSTLILACQKEEL